MSGNKTKANYEEQLNWLRKPEHITDSVYWQYHSEAQLQAARFSFLFINLFICSLYRNKYLQVAHETPGTNLKDITAMINRIRIESNRTSNQREFVLTHTIVIFQYIISLQSTSKIYES